MRDAHKMKERIDLSLDSRQVGTILIGGLVVLSVVFVLGVVVGKRLATPENTEHPADLLTTLDRKADAMEAVQAQPDLAPPAQPSLTFQDELTRKAPEPLPAPVPSEVPAEEVARVLDEAAVPVAAKPVAEPATPTRRELDRLVPDGAVATRTAASSEALKDAVARARKPHAETAPPQPPASGRGKFTLQLSASQSRTEADRFMSKLRDRGFAPYLVEAEVAGKGTWYRVRVGNFPSKEAAQKYLQDFRRETQMDGFVTGTP